MFKSALTHTELSIEIKLPIAVACITQHFSNPSNDIVEAVYQFPLPRDAALTNIRVTINDKPYIGQIIQRHAAEAKYEDGVSEGKRSILILNLGNGLFEINAGNLAPEDNLSIELSVANILSFIDSKAHYYLPTVIAPKYGQPTLSVDHLPQTSLLADYPMQGEMIIHDLDVEDLESSHQLTQLSDKKWQFSGKLDRDVCFSFPCDNESSVLLSTEGGYSSLIALLPQADNYKPSKEFSVQLVIDCSGSMGGISISQVKRGLLEAVTDFSSEDKINLIRFGSSIEPVLNQPQAFNGKDRNKIMLALENMDANLGGTELFNALQLALQQVTNSKQSSDIVLITDGQAWDDIEKINDLIAQAKASGVRLFTIGVGHAVSEDLLARLAEGTEAYHSLVHPHENFRKHISEVLHRLRCSSKKLYVDIESGSSLLTYPKRVFQGQSPVVIALNETKLSGGFTYIYEARPQHCNKVVNAVDKWAEAISKLAAVQYVRSLDDSKAEAFAVAAGIISQHTSYVMVDEVAVEGADGMPELAVTPQMLPEGWGGFSDYEIAPDLHIYSRPAILRNGRYNRSDIPLCDFIDMPLFLRCSESKSASGISDRKAHIKTILEQISPLLDRRLRRKLVLDLNSLEEQGFDRDLILMIEEFFVADASLDEGALVALVLLSLSSAIGGVFNARVVNYLTRLSSSVMLLSDSVEVEVNAYLAECHSENDATEKDIFG